MRIKKEFYVYHKNGNLNKQGTARNVLQQLPSLAPRMIAETLDMDKSEVYNLRKQLGLSKVKGKTRGEPLFKKKETAPIRVPLVAMGSLDEAYDKTTRADDLMYDDMGYSPHATIIRTASQDDPVNHPSHYTVGGIETIDFIEAKGLNYNLGNVVKYITRSDYKGNKHQDLQKALWYLNRELQNSKK